MKSVFSFLKCPNDFPGDDGLGFSISFDDQICPGETFHTVKEEADSMTLTNGEVELTVQYQCDSKLNAVEYKLRAKNISNRSVRMHDVNSLDIHTLSDDKDVYIHSFFGGNAELYYPADNFNEKIVTFCPAQHYPEKRWSLGYRIHSDNGRSSDYDLPIAFIENKEKTGGYYMGIVWSGDWYMEFAKLTDGRFHAIGGMRFLDLIMEPGEEFDLPEIVIGAYEGDSDCGTNAIRRYIVGSRLKKLPENQQLPPVSFDHWFSLGLEISEDILKAQCDRINDLGIEYFVIDAGWYKNDGQGMNFHYGTGNYTIVDNKKFPNGLKPVYDYFEKNGFKGGLWFDPERAGEGTDVATKYPKAMLRTENGGDYHFKSDLCLVDFGDKDIVEYTKAYIKYYVEELGICWIRWDFNLNPRYYWKDNERPGRRGERELAHMKGLYEVLQWINDNYPQVVIEGCASGGRRMDLATMRYSSVFWCNDQCYNAHLSRYLLTTGNKIMPGNYLNRGLTPRLEGEDIPDYYFMSHFGGAFAINDPVALWSDVTRDRCRKHVAVYKQLRKYLLEDYYQLLPAPKSIQDNEAWEFIDPVKQEGFIQVFRTDGPVEKVRIQLKGLECGKYQFTDPYSGVSEEYTYDELKDGMEFTLDKMESKVRLFKKCENA